MLGSFVQHTKKILKEKAIFAHKDLIFPFEIKPFPNLFLSCLLFYMKDPLTEETISLPASTFITAL